MMVFRTPGMEQMIGAIPGRIVQALKQAGSMNPVFMLDEIDKISVGYQGDPHVRLLDPACGSGRFLVGAIRRVRRRCSQR